MNCFLRRTSACIILRTLMLSTLLMGVPTVDAQPLRFEVQNRPHIHYFSLLDCLAAWKVDYCSDYGAIRDEFEKHHPGFLASNEVLLERFDNIRGRYFRGLNTFDKDPRVNRNGLFAWIEAFSADPVAEVVHNSVDESEMMTRLLKTWKPDEVRVLNLLIQAIKKSAPEVEKEIPKFVQKSGLKQVLESEKARKFSDKIVRFYGVKESEIKAFQVSFAWTPIVSIDWAVPIGRTMLLRRSVADRPRNDDDATVFHEFVHYVSAFQDFSKKRKFTDVFLAGCDPRTKNISGLEILEEPMAVAFEMAYRKEIDPKRFAGTKSWYANSWIESYGIALHPLVTSYILSRKPLDETFVRSASEICKSVLDQTQKVKFPDSSVRSTRTRVSR